MEKNGLVGQNISSYVFRAIADCTYDWESWFSQEGQLLWVNAAVERITGYQPHECLKMADYPLSIVASEDRARIAGILQDAKAGGSGNDVEFRVVHREGASRWAAVSWQPMYNQSQQPLGFRASIRDITERHSLREELQLHNQHLEQLVQERTAKIAQLEEHRLKIEKLAALGQLAAGVAHEVNNPLAGIRNAFALFKSNLSPDDENYELLELIDSEIERISSITHQMYQLYRPSQQAPSKFDLQQTVSNVIVLSQPLALESQVEIAWEVASCRKVNGLNEKQVILREGELKQILLNVVRNAIEASPSGGIVKIGVSTSVDEVEILVTDQGPGVSREVATKMFDPFFSSKTSAIRQGMGLGLSVSRSLAEAMGGTITVECPPGRGTRLRVALPRVIACHD